MSILPYFVNVKIMLLCVLSKCKFKHPNPSQNIHLKNKIDLSSSDQIGFLHVSYSLGVILFHTLHFKDILKGNFLLHFNVSDLDICFRFWSFFANSNQRLEISITDRQTDRQKDKHTHTHLHTYKRKQTHKLIWYGCIRSAKSVFTGRQPDTHIHRHTPTDTNTQTHARAHALT